MITLDTLDDETLTRKTKDNYKFRANRLVEVTGKDLEWLMIHPKDTLVLVKKHVSSEPSTLANYITIICKLYSLHPEFIRLHAKPYKDYQTYLKFYRNKVQETYKQSEYKKKQENKIVPWKKLQAYFCEYKHKAIVKTSVKDNLECLLFAFFLNLRPKRADYGNLYVLAKEPARGRAPQGNYVILSPKPYLVLNEYKTAKKRGQIKEDIPFELLVQLKESLTLFPRNYVFVSTWPKTYMKPYAKNNSYSRWVMRTFSKHFGKEMGVSLWRSVYINANVDFQYGKYEDIEKGAQLSGHSVQHAFMVYRKFSEPAVGDQRPANEKGKPVKC